MITDSSSSPSPVPKGHTSIAATPTGTSKRPLLWALGLVAGLAAGIGGYTFRYAEGLSYLSTDPKACVNCHIMRAQYDGWQKASHHTAAVCVDCHLPHEFLPKYLAKAENGFRHSKEFTAQTFEEPITIKARGKEILQANCIRCHEDMVNKLNMGSPDGPGLVECVHCHANVGHGEHVGLGGPLHRSELLGTH
jgi:cytochrome c nitrite reductase small subunit